MLLLATYPKYQKKPHLVLNYITCLKRIFIKRTALSRLKLLYIHFNLPLVINRYQSLFITHLKR